MAPLCMGAGVVMGAAGLQWPGADREADCAMLWTEALGVTTVLRAVVACAAVFGMAVLAQFLSTLSSSRLQQSKAKARRLAEAEAEVAPFARLEQGSSVAQHTSIRPTKEHADATSKTCLSPEHCTSMEPLVPVVTTVTTKMSIQRPMTTATAAAAAMVVIPKVSNLEHLGDSVLHGLRILLAYLLMLAAMTYNAALLVSIVAGFAAGFFWFALDTAKVPASADPCCS